MPDQMTCAILPLGRPTFDVPFAEANLATMLAALEATGWRIAGPRNLLFDAAAARTALEGVLAEKPDFLLLLQVTFTDASMTVEIANAFSGPIGIWAIPEPRAGGRLRLNSFCGLNLASHALGLAGRDFGWLYCDPSALQAGAALGEMLAGGRLAGRLEPKAASEAADDAARSVAASLKGRTIGRIGERPGGFDTCDYDKARLSALAGIGVDELQLPDLFDRARQASPEAVAALKARTGRELSGLDEVDQPQLDKSLALKIALDGLRSEKGYDAFAIRCWPETFTEYGGAVCGPVSMMGEARVPCACEADVYGALTQMILQRVADAPVFLTDLVDLDAEDDSGVVWHCGQAPLSMLAEGAEPALATIHSNRKMPLLYEFPLKPGRVTFARVSQAHGGQALVLAGGEMLDRPKSFTGTSGVVRFDTPAAAMTERVMASGLEHHMALAYGEHRPALRKVAAALGLPVLEL